MKVISTIAMLLVCAMASVSVFAQDANNAAEDVNNPNAKVQDKANTKANQKADAERYNSLRNADTEKATSNDATVGQPYHNYKGIQDSDKAKRAWIKDNPEKYAEMQGEKLPPYYNYKGIEDIDKAKEAWVKDHPEEYNKR